MNLEQDYDLEEIAAAVKMSTKWVRNQIKDGAEHSRYGHKIRMTAAQVEKLRASHVKAAPAAQSITTGRKRRTA